MLLCLILAELKPRPTMTNCNVLITSAGRRVSLVRLFKQALNDLGVDGLVCAVDLQAHAPALQVADRFKTIVRVTDADYISQLLEVCISNNIRLVVPTIDTELDILSKSADLFNDRGIKILVCESVINQIFRDKRNSQSFFESNDIPTPHLYSTEEAMSLSLNEYPLLLKPAYGSCSIGVTKVNNQKELSFFLEYLDDAIVQEFVEGDEYTVDVLIDFNGKARCAVPRLRLETRAGEVSKAITINDKTIIDWSYKVVSALKGAVGCITIQCIKSQNGDLKFIEVNPRFGGGFPLSATAGAHFPRWILQMTLGMNIEDDLQGLWKENCVMLRYDEGLFTTTDKVGL